MKKSYLTVDEYISDFPKDIQKILEKIRQAVKKVAPLAEEEIAYQMSAYKLNKKPLVYFGAFTNHIGFYTTPTGHLAFKKELSVYKQGKGTVQFPLDKPVPLNLIKNIVIFRIKENQQKTKKK